MKNLKKVMLIVISICFMITVINPIVEHAAVKINKTSKTMYVGDTYTLKITGTNKKAKWSSSNATVATVSNAGRVKAKSSGKATIMAKIGKNKYKCKIIVRKRKVDVSWIEIEKSEISIEKGKTYRINASVYPDDATESRISWNTSDNTIATVDKNGNIKAGKIGMAIITATVGGKSAQCEVFVYENINKDIYHDSNVKINLQRISFGTYPDEYIFHLEIDNTSGRDICVQARDTSLNGYMVEPIFSSDILDGKKIKDELYIFASDVDGGDICDMETKFNIFSTDDWEYEYETGIIKII